MLAAAAAVAAAGADSGGDGCYPAKSVWLDHFLLSTAAPPRDYTPRIEDVSSCERPGGCSNKLNYVPALFRSGPHLIDKGRAGGGVAQQNLRGCFFLQINLLFCQKGPNLGVNGERSREELHGESNGDKIERVVPVLQVCSWERHISTSSIFFQMPSRPPTCILASRLYLFVPCCG